jgi:hypothetical protein
MRGTGGVDIALYFNKVPTLTDQVAVGEAEKCAAAAQGAH